MDLSVEDVECPDEHPQREDDQIPDCVLARVGEPRDHVPAVHPRFPGHAETIACPAGVAINGPG